MKIEKWAVTDKDDQPRSTHLDTPLHWRNARHVVVMSDLFHEQVPTEFIDKVFGIMALTPQHTYQVLTKRPERMRDYLRGARSVPVWVAARDRMLEPLHGRTWVYPGGPMDDKPWPLPNVWLGTSVENQHWADVRIPLLLDTPAAVRFLSCEPLLGPVDLRPYLTCSEGGCAWHGEELWCICHNPGLHWVIVGGESGPGARPMALDWVRGLRDQCQAAKVAFFYKQQGGPRPGMWRLLDGRTWDEFPVVAR